MTSQQVMEEEEREDGTGSSKFLPLYDTMGSCSVYNCCRCVVLLCLCDTNVFM